MHRNRLLTHFFNVLVRVNVLLAFTLMRFISFSVIDNLDGKARVDFCNLYRSPYIQHFLYYVLKQFEIKLRRICKSGIDFLLHHYSFSHFGREEV